MSVPSAPILPKWPSCRTTSIRFWWQPPATGTPITTYTLACTAISFTQDISGDQTDYTVTSLTAGTEYEFTLTATNGSGTGPALAFPKVAVGAIPFGPSQATASTIDATTAIINWTPSTIADQAPVRWYIVQAIPSTAGASTLYKTEYNYRTSTFIKGISTNTYYRFLVQGVGTPGYCIPFAYTSTLGFGITSFPFSPSSLTGLQLWLDAGDTATVTLSGSNVTGWADKSGTSKTLAISPIKPYRVINAQNSMNSIYFTAASQTYVSTTLSSAVGTGDVNMFAVWKALGSNTTSVTGLGGLNGVGGTMGMGWHASGKYLVYDYAVNETTFTSGNGAWVVEVGQRQNGVLQTTVNGSTSATISGPTSFTNTSLVVGSGPGFYGNGEVGEAMIYTGFITPYDRQKAEGYLAWKWGLQTNLVASHPFKLAAPTGASVFSPSNFSTLQIWYDGADPLGTGSVPSNGTSITTWSDKSGRSNHATAGNAATYVTDATGNYLLFDGSNTKYNITSGSFITNTTFQIFVVERLQAFPKSADSYVVNFFGGTGTSAGNNLFLRYYLSNASGIDGSYYGGAGYSVQNTSVPAFTTASAQPTRMWGFTQLTSNMSIYLNSSNIVSSNYNARATSWAGAALGWDPSLPGRYYPGHMKEILMFTGDMSTDDRQTVEGYLAWKWGLQGSLPTTHPYKFLSPASNYAGAVVPQGLLVRFDATTYSGSGAWINTGSLGTNYNATITAGQTPAKNAAGNGIVFNGSSGWTFPNIGQQTSFTISSWVKRTAVTPLYVAVVSDGTSGTSQINMAIIGTHDSIPIANTDVRGGFYDGTTWRTGTSVTLTSNIWIYVTATFDNTSKNLITYVNGSSVNTTTHAGLTPNTSAVSYRIGQHIATTLTYFTGEIGQVLIYNRALTAAEVAQNYAATSNTFSV